MTEKDLKKLNRKQLLELLLKQTEHSEMLQQRLDEAERKLADRTLMESEAGSIAEASLKLNGVFEAAEAAANQYVQNIKKLAAREAAAKVSVAIDSSLHGEELLDETTRRCAELKAETEHYCNELKAKTEIKCVQLEAEARAKLEGSSKVLRLMYTQKKLLDSIFKDHKTE